MPNKMASEDKYVNLSFVFGEILITQIVSYDTITKQIRFVSDMKIKIIHGWCYTLTEE